MASPVAEILKAQHRAELIGEVDEEQKTLAWRVEQFVECGFEDQQAVDLANGKDELGFHLDWHRAKQLLDKGCTHDWVYNYMRSE